MHFDQKVPATDLISTEIDPRLVILYAQGLHYHSLRRRLRIRLIRADLHPTQCLYLSPNLSCAA
ncbi:unnamed protein product [Amoebophrya sp. A120]|nr:unnamed protein product [Amoebophrya sp. A120]|eukprot:GSA120T00006786001.1